MYQRWENILRRVELEIGKLQELCLFAKVTFRYFTVGLHIVFEWCFNYILRSFFLLEQ